MGAPPLSWHDANQRFLIAAVAVVRAAVARHAAQGRGAAIDNEQASAPDQALREASAALAAPSALDTLCATFGLSPFERDLLLLCAGMECDAAFAPLCAAAQGDASRPYPTFGLAVAALPNSHWSALTPAGPLRRWRLIELGAGSTLIVSPLRIDERILHYLAGVHYTDARLAGLLAPLAVDGPLAPSHAAVADRLAALWSRAEHGAELPIILLSGAGGGAKRAVAAAACARLGLPLQTLSAADLPLAADELDRTALLAEREAALAGGALLLDSEDLDPADAAREHALDRVLDQMTGPLIVTGRQLRRPRQRLLIDLDVAPPTIPERRAIWQDALGAAGPALTDQVDALVAQFDLGPAAVRAACTEALAAAPSTAEQPIPAAPELGRLLWQSARTQARPRLDDLAQRLEPAATWDDLILPELACQTLQQIAAQVRQRATVYETWRFGAADARGLGISALFAGESGTGKTMAAEVLAGELQLDLYRIDLAAVVSKYIGETEKNLRRVFDAAEAGGGVLLFDEADALFGKRSEVKDSHDRYANIEVSYLLQRMEAYRGLAILTTNMKDALDRAFLRRIRFVVQFPFPEAAARAEIWRRIFPAAVPTAGLDLARLAQLSVTGGSIRTIALNAAFLAADAREPVQMAHLLQAARIEYAKLDKPLSGAEIRGWTE